MLACFAPLVLVGMLSSVGLPYHSVRNASEYHAGMVEVQTCQEALALNARLSTNEIYTLGVQYGLKGERGEWNYSLAPSVGGAYLGQSFQEQSSRVTFAFGLQAMGGYNRYRVAATLMHLSTGDMSSRNVGLDMLALTTGVEF